ncbi:hypothetical protein BATDEDRAFT_86516 [Batrachochytrium dendrobatidis JAM81]|uniref:Large ribosomal subunit protein mL53 n=1 Tax=Batrachochytrium dendrobatidis (strain JAM81 / FGSC 10211) TaxID=684364 RepID=F4NXC3_BATDJ|nr:uncharacterized protein BATDEDRAFT_86516 [Batrachochytrium dendrobatidis JAM81]EGF82650.1 hypothetical protein BATDEDRAFT_86516 [Batrachochytrium dendrobatidis JAM81]KAJ8328417.1 39S ribosomal protein L44, mitochondrial [Batrachochytrium dendrobatidis]KAK5673475.1 39S ribosomal protein L44, mitochondrial [Batrachochytrium dendrobatidis]|eukprot:XP_006677002.1 hypothetical protein BATDEDRAFT_86516 [Batrachochytrium dendrobatidis JAM81]
MLKFIDKVVIGFAPLSPVSTSARTLASILRTDRNLARNPKCVFDIITSDKTPRPFIQVTYADKQTIRLDTSKLTANEVLDDIRKHSRRLQMSEDIKSSV